MDPFFARNRLSALIDGDLSEDEEQELRAVIAANPALAAELSQMEDALGLLREAAPVRAPAGFEARVMAEVNEGAGVGGVLVRLRAFTQRLPVEALALAAAAAVVVVVIQGRPEDGGERAASAEAAPEQGAPPPLQAAAPKVTSPAEAPVDPELPTPGARAPRPRGAPAAQNPPEEAYVPAWDREADAGPGGVEPTGAAEAPGAAPVAVAMRMTVTDPDVPLHLVNLCEGLGGMVLDSRGKGTQGAALTAEDNYAALTFVVPAAAGPDFERQLKALGARRAGGGAVPVGADQAGFVVEIMLNP
ncbi:MAG: hypothetical protein JNM72_04855 [Deltaproteobacteria bacterium]|nr:hypothetical protein [Deltaproteobacteria bacterium]